MWPLRLGELPAPHISICNWVSCLVNFPVEINLTGAVSQSSGSVGDIVSEELGWVVSYPTVDDEEPPVALV